VARSPRSKRGFARWRPIFKRVPLSHLFSNSLAQTGANPYLDHHHHASYYQYSSLSFRPASSKRRGGPTRYSSSPSPDVHACIELRACSCSECTLTGAARKRSKAWKGTRVCFLMSRPVIQRDADGRRTNMCWPGLGVRTTDEALPAPTLSACLPAACTRPFGSTHPSVDSIHNHLSRTPKVLGRGHNTIE
jgi:hypothetical protein